MSRFVKIAAFAAILVFAAPTAIAQKPVSASSPVTYADLDLSAAAGVQTLLKRIDVASRKVCGKRPMTVRYGQLEKHLACRETAMNDAVERINHPTVTLAWAGEAGKAMRVALR
jgi:UrcA family protein